MRFLPLVFVIAAIGCGRESPEPASSSSPAAPPRHLLLITIDTLRADHVGIYGWRNAQTATLDALARRGTRFSRAFATAPITLSSHASILSGRYPPGHGARHNGLAVNADAPTLAAVLRQAGFRTAAFVSAFPLDRRFGLNRGFDVYDDELPRGLDGRPLNERPGAATIDRSIAWLRTSGPVAATRLFVWVHLFEPHAPYGTPSAGPAVPRPASDRYDDEVAVADREIGRLLDAWPDLADTLVVATSDHGEAFGEHGEIGHSIFVYDTTLRVPLILAAPGIVADRVVDQPVALIDLAPTVLRMLGAGTLDGDGIDLGPAVAGGSSGSRDLYAESFAPLLDFGWAPLRSLRRGGLKFIAAPRPEVYDVHADRDETRSVIDTHAQVVRELADRVDRISSTELPARAAGGPGREARARLQALGYAGTGKVRGSVRPDPKDRIATASRIAAVTSGELQGADLERALHEVLRDDPSNPQAHLRLGYRLADSGRCSAAEPHFAAAIASGLPSADPYLGLARCKRERRDDAAALSTLRAGRRTEPGNAAVEANIGLLELDNGRVDAALAPLTEALRIQPDLHQARFALARALARAGRRAEAEHQATDLLSRLPATAPQRSEVERLLAALR